MKLLRNICKLFLTMKTGDKISWSICSAFLGNYDIPTDKRTFGFIVTLPIMIIMMIMSICQGFYCMDHGFPEGTVADGCIKTCRDDEILIVNPANYEWDCVPIAVKLVVINGY